MPEIDTANRFLIGVLGPDVVFMKPVPQRLSADDALLLAAHLVAMAEVQRPTHRFEDVLKAVQNA